MIPGDRTFHRPGGQWLFTLAPGRRDRFSVSGLDYRKTGQPATVLMMGSLGRRKNGIYSAIFSRHGRRLWRSTGARTPEEARRRYYELEAEFESPGRVTLQGFTEALLGILQGRLAGSTLQLYASALRKLREFCGNKRVGAVTPLDAERFIAARLREVSAVKASIDLRTLWAAFGRARALGFVEGNPFRGSARIPERTPAVLRASEPPSLLAATGSAQMRGIIVLALATGMRLGELLSLRREDVDPERGAIRVRNRGAFCTKNRRSRTIPMNRTAERVFELESHRSFYGTAALSRDDMAGAAPGTALRPPSRRRACSRRRTWPDLAASRSGGEWSDERATASPR